MAGTKSSTVFPSELASTYQHASSDVCRLKVSSVWEMKEFVQVTVVSIGVCVCVGWGDKIRMNIRPRWRQLQTFTCVTITLPFFISKLTIG